MEIALHHSLLLKIDQQLRTSLNSSVGFTRCLRSWPLQLSRFSSLPLHSLMSPTSRPVCMLFSSACHTSAIHSVSPIPLTCPFAGVTLTQHSFRPPIQRRLSLLCHPLLSSPLVSSTAPLIALILFYRKCFTVSCHNCIISSVKKECSLPFFVSHRKENSREKHQVFRKYLQDGWIQKDESSKNSI